MHYGSNRIEVNLEKQVYDVQELSLITGKSANLIYRRLTEKDSKYRVKYARKEGDRWVFDKDQIDKAIQNGESIIVKKGSLQVFDTATALKYLKGRSRSCGKGTFK